MGRSSGKLFKASWRVSALLLLATAVLWGRSYVHGFAVRYATERHPLEAYYLTSAKGQLGFARFAWTSPAAPAQFVKHSAGLTVRAWAGDADPIPPSPRWPMTSQYGFVVRSGRFGAGVMHVWVVPYYAVAAAMLVLPAAAAWRWRRGTRRETADLCRDCGYDLRASPGRCPECGAVKA